MPVDAFSNAEINTVNMWLAANERVITCEI